MRLRQRSATAPALVLVLGFVVAAAPAAARFSPDREEPTPPRATAPSAPSPRFFQRSDVVFALASAGAVVITGHNDRWLRSKAVAADSPFERRLASVAQPLGNPAFVLPALLAGFGVARALHAPGVASGFTELGLSVVAAGAGALVLKEAVGRARPEQSAGDSHSFHPFSGRLSFPSGHSTEAFALAESIRLASGSRWTPWLTYPAAALVGWSRIRDDQHWTSDVVAGAALGVWTARKVHRMLPAERRLLSRFGWSACLPDGTPGLLVTLR